MSLFDSSNKGVKFTNVGDEITGTIAGAPYERQQTKFGTQEPDFWPDGTPKMQILVPLQTALREDPNDNGERTLYVASKNMKSAIGQAIRAAGASDITPGGTLTVKYVGNDPASKNPANPAKLYQATYTPGASPLAAAPQTAQAPVATTAAAAVPATPQPVQQAAPAAPAGLTQAQAAQVVQLRAAGIPDATIATAVGVDVAVIATVPF